MRILITGGSGLLALNWAFVARTYADVTLLAHSHLVKLAGVNSLNAETFDLDTLMEIARDVRPDILVNAAGMTNVDMCEAHPSAAMFANATIAKHVATIANHLKIKLVHISTDHLFDGQQGWCDENSPVSPLNEYAKTKLAGEELVRSECPDALIVRTNFYGWGSRIKRSFSDWVIESLRAGKKIPAFGDVFITPLLIDQLVAGIEKCLLKNAVGVFNLSGENRVSKYDFALAIADVFQLDRSLIQRASLNDVQLEARRPHDMSLSSRKAQHVLAPHSLGGLEEGLQLLKQQEVMRCRELHTALRDSKNSDGIEIAKYGSR